jgi:beta-N-acetylhexosaminidase
MPVSQLERFGHHLILGISGTTLSDDDKRALSELKPIGVNIFCEKFSSGYSLSSLAGNV